MKEMDPAFFRVPDDGQNPKTTTPKCNAPSSEPFRIEKDSVSHHSMHVYGHFLILPSSCPAVVALFRTYSSLLFLLSLNKNCVSHPVPAQEHFITCPLVLHLWPSSRTEVLTGPFGPQSPFPHPWL
jgi:hypothetical protein